MDIRERVLMTVPSSKTKIQPANECCVVVDDNEFLVMCPVEGHVCSMLEDIVIGMAHNLEVAMTFCALRAKSLECMLCVGGVAGESGLDG